VAPIPAPTPAVPTAALPSAQPLRQRAGVVNARMVANGAHLPLWLQHAHY